MEKKNIILCMFWFLLIITSIYTFMTRLFSELYILVISALSLVMFLFLIASIKYKQNRVFTNIFLISVIANILLLQFKNYTGGQIVSGAMFGMGVIEFVNIFIFSK